jgi:heterodisulfide reductase subunit C
MDLPPAQIRWSVLAGRSGEILSSKAIWVCVSCQACSARCPNGIDVARVIDALRAIVVREGRRPAVPGIASLHKELMAGVRERGRVYELDVLPLYRLGQFDLQLALLFKGKFRILSQVVKQLETVAAALDLEQKAGGESK